MAAMTHSPRLFTVRIHIDFLLTTTMSCCS